ncbi:hypothetical protein [Devosia marina]|uniref:Uncharacterized protein n=1 Tax=Devosia marina TaxID=2683198 RepID=A0A7X3FRC3_9HYPH|nr:hypothetical protein [Devosia marina]MVS99339.1 hypothetical protein [Devosia marina]
MAEDNAGLPRFFVSRVQTETGNQLAWQRGCSASGINGLVPSVKPWAGQVANGATEKGCPLRTALPELIGLKGPGGVLLAEITPAQHMKTQTFLKRQNLIRHWITSFAFVEHEVSLPVFSGPVQSRKIRP